MMGINHAAMGGSTWILLTSTAPVAMHVNPLPPTWVIGGAFLSAGAALLADADHHNASIAHSAPGGKIVAGAVGTLTGGHRHGTHSLLALVAVIFGALALGGVTIPGVGDSVIPIGVGIATMIIVGFGLKAMKLMQGSWVKPFVGGAAVALFVMVMTPGEDWEWFVWSVGIGYAVHLLGDFLTTGGLTLLWPWVPKPPKWWSATPVLNRLWMKNGYMSFPILGNAGSVVEYVLSMFFYVYFAYGIFFESTIVGTEALDGLFSWWDQTVSAIGDWWDSLWSWLPF